MRAERDEGKRWEECPVLLQYPVHAHPEGGAEQEATDKAAHRSQRVGELLGGIDQVD